MKFRLYEVGFKPLDLPRGVLQYDERGRTRVIALMDQKRGKVVVMSHRDRQYENLTRKDTTNMTTTARFNRFQESQIIDEIWGLEQDLDHFNRLRDQGRISDEQWDEEVEAIQEDLDRLERELRRGR